MKGQKTIAALVCALLLAGCGQVSALPGEETKEDNLVSMEETPDVASEVSVNASGILVNPMGYVTGSGKTVIFKGTELPEIFYLMDAENGKCVYTGSLQEKGYNEEFSEYNGYGDFTDFRTPGNYYIEAPVLGRSCSFLIGDGVYNEVFREACRQYYYNRCGMTLPAEYAGEKAHSACHTGKALLQEDISVSLDVTGGWHQDEKGQKDVAAAAQAAAVMLLSYELYPEVFTDDLGIPESGNGIPDILDEVKYEVDWMLKMQDQKTGGVYGGLRVYAPNRNVPGKAAEIYAEPFSPRAERMFAMALAKFTYLYQDYDSKYAAACFKAADRAWKHAELGREDENQESVLGDEKARFAAAAELYRAAGQRGYRRYVDEYLENGKFQDGQDEITLLGCVAYISTKRPVNLSLCEKIMEMLMTRGEDISWNASEGIYLVADDESHGNIHELLLQMAYLTVVNRIITNHEYETVIENHLHYLSGRNGNAVNYVGITEDGRNENTGSSLEITKQFDENSKLILMLAGIMDSIHE